MSINIDELTVEQIKGIVATFSGIVGEQPQQHPAVGQIAVIRCYSAGVFAGKVSYVNGQEVHLEYSHRIWRWEGAFTLTKVAREGITGGRTVYNSAPHYLTDVIEIIPMTSEALETVRACNE